MTLISRAAAGFVAVWAACMACAVQAQSTSSVTLYGVVDLSVGGISSQNAGTSLKMLSGVQSGSRWGLRGSEDLGGGTRANFVLESGFLANEGRSAQGSRLFGRAAWLGLSGDWGEWRLGRQTSASSLTLADFDAFLGSYLITGAQTTLLPYNANRSDNTLAYWTPTIGGLRAGVDYSFSYDGQGYRTPASSKLMSGALVYDRDAFALTATYEGAHWGQGTTQEAAMRAAGGDEQPYAATLAGKWRLNPVTLYAAWSMMRNGSTLPGVISPGQRAYFPGSTVDGAMVGAAWRVDAGTVLASWQASMPRSSGALGRDEATHSQQVYSIGYGYDLTKRTNLYAIYGYVDGAWHDADWRESQYAAGIRHRF